MTDDEVKVEIIERCKRAATNYGIPRGVAYKMVVYILKLTGPELGDLTIFWLPLETNLRVRLSIPELGHDGSRSIVDVREKSRHHGSIDGGTLQTVPAGTKWHYTDRNDIILKRLRALMLLDDLADV